jgi:CRP-like cAMP-binding protein
MITEALTKVPLLKDLTESQLAKLSDSVEILPFPAGDVIIVKGVVENVFYMIKEGNVMVTNIGDGKTFPDHSLGPGEYFGERALLKGEPRAAEVTASTNVVLMALDRLAFTSLLGPLKELLDANLKEREGLTIEKLMSERQLIHHTYELSDFKFVTELGSGTFGRVTLVMEKKSKNIFALKTMSKSKIVMLRQQVLGVRDRAKS